jgi:hypothetical protein
MNFGPMNIWAKAPYSQIKNTSIGLMLMGHPLSIGVMSLGDFLQNFFAF